MRPRPRPLRLAIALPFLGALAAAAAACVDSPTTQACFRAPEYTMEILVDGRPLRALGGGARTYVEALRDREYSIRLTNRTGGRVAAALSVDGLNVIDAKRTSAREARKWILGPWETITLDGWQVSAGTARRFVFTTEADSYGAWLGRTSDLGVISAAFFRERVLPPPPPPAPITGRSDASGAPSAAEPLARAQEREKKDNAATGIGREVDHQVVQVVFDAEPDPAAVVTLRYEYRDALVRLGVLPRSESPLARRERATGFTDTGFAPSPK